MAVDVEEFEPFGRQICASVRSVVCQVLIFFHFDKPSKGTGQFGKGMRNADCIDFSVLLSRPPRKEIRISVVQ